MIGTNKKLGFTLGMQRERAFTLVELLIAASITVVIVLLLGTMFGSLLNVAARANERVDVFRDARAALQIMERDLSNLVRTQWTPDPFAGSTTVPCTAPNPLPSTTPVTLPAAYLASENRYSDPGAGNQQLYALIAVKPTGSSVGDVCAVGYYCRWDGSPYNRYTLRRFSRDSAHTLAALQSAGTYAADSVLYDLNAPDARNDLLAAYVWNFNVVLYDASGNRYSTYPCICDQSATTPTMAPAAIEISFNIMSPQAARAVMSVPSSASDWMSMTGPSPSPTTTYQRLIQPHAYQFRTRINFQ